jgi:hypothetical protein
MAGTVAGLAESGRNPGTIGEAIGDESSSDRGLGV